MYKLLPPEPKNMQFSSCTSFLFWVLQKDTSNFFSCRGVAEWASVRRETFKISGVFLKKQTLFVTVILFFFVLFAIFVLAHYDQAESYGGISSNRSCWWVKRKISYYRCISPPLVYARTMQATKEMSQNAADIVWHKRQYISSTCGKTLCCTVVEGRDASLLGRVLTALVIKPNS